jgi:hypothetical protein
MSISPKSATVGEFQKRSGPPDQITGSTPASFRRSPISLDLGGSLPIVCVGGAAPGSSRTVNLANPRDPVLDRPPGDLPAPVRGGRGRARTGSLRGGGRSGG